MIKHRIPSLIIAFTTIIGMLTACVPTRAAKVSSFSISDAYYTVSSEGYLADCKEIYPESFAGQLSYEGIIPGVSTKQDVEKILGVPIETVDYDLEGWGYDRHLWIMFSKGQVESIEMFEISDDYFPMEKYLEKFGCPEIIIAIDANEHPMGSYSMTTLAYPQNGIEITYLSFPIKVNQKPDWGIIRKSASILEYLQGRDFLEAAGKAKLVLSWADAVGE